LADEFEIVGMPFANRAARTREAIRMLKTLWSEPAPSFEGRFHRFPPLGFGPKPVQQPHPPIILGGESPAALKRAAEVGDGWIGVAQTPQSVAPMIAALREHRVRAGRRVEGFEITVGPPPGLGLDLSTVDAYAAAGVDRLFTFAPGFVPRGKLSSDLFPAMERFAADVMRG